MPNRMLSPDELDEARQLLARLIHRDCDVETQAS